MTTEFVVREATLDDIPILAHHRAGMFRDMGRLPDSLVESMHSASSLYFGHALTEDEYVAWLASPADDPATIVAGAGLQLRPALPTVRLEHDTVVVATGLQGLIVNVFTEPAWRRRGLARLLMQHVIAAARARCAGGIVLHASPEGRPLYESLGFVATNEMRLTTSPSQ
jgi:GNAT superfamily N-acetyltransferase